MKIVKKYCLRFIDLLAIWILIASCASNKDTYRNPYKDNITKNSGSISRTTVLKEASIDQPPEWRYAVSKDFYVGNGQGKDVIEARDAALNNIKTFIIKSLGESGSIVEINFVQNSQANRSLPQSNAEFYQ